MGSGKANTKRTRRWEGGEGLRGLEVHPRAFCPAPRGRPGGQLLYWHALRPEAGPCRPP